MNQSDKICAYDSLFTNNHIQILKILLSSIKPPLQYKLAVYIKFLELQYTLNFISRNPSSDLSLFGCCSTDTSGSPRELLNEILPYCDDSEREQISQIQNLFQSMANIQEMMDVMEMMKDVAPEFTSENDVSQMMDMMQGFFQN